MRAGRSNWPLRAGALALVGCALAVGCGSSDGSGGERNGALDDAGGTDADSGAAPPDADADADGDAGPNVDADPDTGLVDAPDGVAEASADAEVDTGAEDGPLAQDSGPDGPVGPPVCGDGWRDPLTEECDDGTGSTPPDSCSVDCRVQELPVLLPSTTKAKRQLGLGRHPIAAGDAGFAVAYVNYVTFPVTVALRAFGPKGEPLGSELILDSGLTAHASADPVVAALPNGKYAVVWMDVNGPGDGSGWGIALSIVDPLAGSVGPRIRVNGTTQDNQHSPDVVWTGTELVVAWEDQSKFLMTKSDLRLRRFDGAGKPIAQEQLLAGTADQELRLCLAKRQGGGWAAAWRTADLSGDFTRVAIEGKQWAVGPVSWAPDGEAPVLIELDATHLLVVFLDGGLGLGTSRLRGAVIDTTQSTAPAPFAIDPLEPAYAADPSLDQEQPSIARAGDRLYLAWRSGTITGTPEVEELWLKEIGWQASGGGMTIDLSHSEIALPRWPEHRKGEQSWPGLAGAPLWPEGALATTWTDWGTTFGTGEGQPDVIVEFIPTPVLRLSTDGGIGE